MSKNNTTNAVRKAAGYAAAILLGGFSAGAYGRQAVFQDDFVIGSNQSGNTSVTLVHPLGSISPSQNYVVNNYWSTPSIEAIHFDNYGGIQHNGAGNLLGVNFGTSSAGGSIYSMATDGSAGSQKIFGFDNPAFSNLSLDQLGGISVNPNNSLLSVTGNSSGNIYVFNYTPGNTHGAGAALSNGIQSGGGTLLNAPGSSSGTYGTTWYDNSHILALDGAGNLHEDLVSGGKITDSIFSHATDGDPTGSYTSIAYNPAISPYVFAMTSAFTYAQGSNPSYSANTLSVYDPSQGFKLVHTGNFSSIDTTTGKSLAGGLDDTARDIAFDKEGDLLVSEYSSTSGSGNTIKASGTLIYEIPNAAANALTASADAVLLGPSNPSANPPTAQGFGPASSYPGLDVALNPPPAAQTGRALTWTGSATSATPSDASGTWDNATANWTPDKATNVVWSDTNPDNATFGAGKGTSGTGATTITVSGTRTVGSLAFAANSNAYTLTGGTILLNGDADGNGLNAQQSTTINSNLTLGNANGATDQLVGIGNGTSTPTLTLNGVVSGVKLTKIGTGTLVLTNGANTMQGISLAVGAIQVTTDAPLGPGSLDFQGGTLKVAAAYTFPSTRVFNNVAGGAIDTGTNNVTLANTVNGTSGVVMAKAGAGTLTLATPDENYTGGWNVQAGTLLVNSVDSNFVSGLGAGGSGIANSVQVQNGATLKLANVQLGQRSVTTSNGTTTTTTYYAPDIYLNNGSTTGATLLATGNSSFNGGSLNIIRTSPTAKAGTQNNATIQTSAATDVFTIQNAVKQYDLNATPFDQGDARVTLHVAGPGRVVLQSGGTSSYSTFGGSWAVDGGILQVGPVAANPTPDTSTNGYAGPYGEPLNALGFRSLAGSATPQSGDPDQPNPATINSGGILAVAVDAPNTNPNIASADQPFNPTPNYLRNPITLNGGAIASTGYEVSYSTSTTGPQGVPTSTPVTAQFGGNFAVNAGTTSRVLTYDPVNGGARSVSLVGGSRTVTNAIPGDKVNTYPYTITYNTSWAGTLNVDPGSTSGGAFNVLRDGGTVSVTPGATIHNLANAVLNAGGAADAFTDTATPANHVAIVNDGTFNITTGSKTIASLTGAGTTHVAGGATLAIAANSLTNANGFLNVDTGGTLDLTKNKLVINSGATDSSVGALVKSGYSGGTWNGTGIVSTAAKADPSHYGIGYGNSTDGISGLQAGQEVVEYARLGDANLDGGVGIDDFNVVSQNFGNSGGWTQGDFNNDGNVGIDDFNIVSQNFGGQLTGAQAAALVAWGQTLPTSSERFAVDSFVASHDAVPEPGTLSLVGLGAVLFGGVRCRRAH